LYLKINNTQAIINRYIGDPVELDENVILDVPPMIINGSTMVPLRFVAEKFGLDVEFVNGIVMLSNNFQYSGVGEATTLVQTLSNSVLTNQFPHTHPQNTFYHLSFPLSLDNTTNSWFDREPVRRTMVDWSIYHNNASGIVPKVYVTQETSLHIYSLINPFILGLVGVPDDEAIVLSTTDGVYTFDTISNVYQLWKPGGWIIYIEVVANQPDLTQTVTTNIPTVVTPVQTTPINTPALVTEDRILEFEREILKHINDFRASQGVHPLILHELASDVAREHSRDIIINGNLHGSRHIGSDGRIPSERLLEVGLFGGSENVTFSGLIGTDNISILAERAVNSWIVSEGHRRNLLSRVSHIGIGYYPGDVGGMVTAKFLTYPN